MGLSVCVYLTLAISETISETLCNGHLNLTHSQFHTPSHNNMVDMQTCEVGVTHSLLCMDQRWWVLK